MQLATPFVHLKSVMSPEDVKTLRKIYSEYIPSAGIPCYAFLERQSDDIFQKIQTLVGDAIGSHAYYLNDFFFYTDTTFATPWHVDTELYIFKYAVNAWILLEPDQIENPLAFISQTNNPSQTFYHSVEKEDDLYAFVDYFHGDVEEYSVSEVEHAHVKTPQINTGDILLIDPQRFHRTNTTIPKGACVFKFVYSDETSLLRIDQVPGIMWPEVALYKDLVSKSQNWTDVLAGIRDEIRQNSIKSPLVSGFYPDQFKHLSEKASLLNT